MRGEPSPTLVNRLTRLRLATAEQIAGVAPRARRLAGDLPDFESVWVDALVQARILTPLQGAEINAGREATLVHGPYIIRQALPGVHYAACFAARHVETLRLVRLHVVPRPQITSSVAARGLATWVERLAPLRDSTPGVVEEAGAGSLGVWAACPMIDGITAAEWMIENGRVSPAVVLSIARQMLADLIACERLGVVHGDLGAAGLLLQKTGRVVLPMAGLRAIVRPHEGYSFGDLQPEAYDYLAPERIAEGTAPTIASDLYACGCLWWHLLTGRAPFAGGNSLFKLRAVHAAKLVDVREMASEVPEVLASAIEMCLAREPEERPRSFGELAEHLGPATRSGSALVARWLHRQAGPWHGVGREVVARPGTGKRMAVAASVAMVVVAATLGLRSLGRSAQRMRLAATAKAEALKNDTPSIEKVAQPSETTASREENPREDRSIRLAGGVQPIDTSENNDLILPADSEVLLDSLNLKPGQRVRSPAGERSLVRVSGRGIVVSSEDVLFAGIDFVWEEEGAEQDEETSPGAIVIVQAETISFRGCSFSTAANRPPVAIAWAGPREAMSTTGGELTFSDCVVSGVTAVVDCRGATSLTVEMNNVLCVASGPIVRLSRPPSADASIAVSLERVTLRGDSGVLECRYGSIENSPGAITIRSSDSVFDTNRGGGLVIFSGAQRPEALLAATSWNGQGSLLTPRTAVALWRPGAKKQQVLSEDSWEVDGLVRSEVEFAGEAAGAPSASRVTRWQVPLHSADPPGANPERLSLPAQ